MSAGMDLANLLYAQLQLNSEAQQQSFHSFDASSLSDPKSSSSTPSDRYLSSRPSLCASLSLPESFYPSQLSPATNFQNGIGHYQDQLTSNHEIDVWHQEQSTSDGSRQLSKSDRRSCSLGEALAPLGRQILPSTPSMLSSSSGSGQSSTPSGRYKTELCRPFEEHGTCRYGSKCQFAHGRSELRTVSRHPKYKTDLCRTYHSTGLCPYGPRCHFVHNEEERGTEIQQYRAEDHQAQLQQQHRQMLIIQQQQQQQQQQQVAEAAAARQRVQLTRGLRQQVSVFGDDEDDAETLTLPFNGAFPTRLERPRASLPSVSLFQQQQQTSWEIQQQQQQMRRMSVADPLHHYNQQQTVSPRSQFGLTNPPPGFTSTFSAQPTYPTSSLQLPRGVAGSIGSAAESIPSTASSVTDSPSPSPTSGLFLSEDPVWQQPSNPSTSWAAASVPSQAGCIDEMTSSKSTSSSSSSSQLQDLLKMVSQMAPDQLEKILELYRVLNLQQPQQLKPAVLPSQQLSADLFTAHSPAADPWSQQPFHQFSITPSAALSAGNAVW